MIQLNKRYLYLTGLSLVFSFSANSLAGSLSNLSYNGSVNDTILPALTVDQAATFVFTAEGVDGTGGTTASMR